MSIIARVLPVVVLDWSTLFVSNDSNATAASDFVSALAGKAIVAVASTPAADGTVRVAFTTNLAGLSVAKSLLPAVDAAHTKPDPPRPPEVKGPPDPIDVPEKPKIVPLQS